MEKPLRLIFLALCLSLVIPVSWTNAADVPEGFGQLENAPKILSGGVDEEGRSFVYLGQAATNDKLILTASNGFFTGRVATAKGESDLPKKGDEDLIVSNFAYLDWSGAESSLRWHLLVNTPGTIQFQVHLEVSDPGSKIDVSFAGETKRVSTSKSNSDRPQPWNLSFEVAQPGQYTLALQATEVASGRIGNLYRVDVHGPALTDGHLLRVRWRPAAVHGGYDTQTVRGAKLLVFTTRSVADVSSYSPVTTPFGYYGTSFDDQRRSNGSFNFSMWGKEGAASDLKTMPHLLGLGSPDGIFSGFGHEGSGVKPRGWDPMPDHPEVVVQALRVEAGAEYNTFYGYYFDHPTGAWKFYAAGNQWHGGKPNEHLRLGSFCEVPGPPQNQRTGDVYREVRRRGWAWEDGSWSPLEIYSPGGAGSSGDPPVNKLWYTTDEGEYAMGCGGIRLYPHDPSRVHPTKESQLPEFLTSPSVEMLFTLPIEFGEIQATEVGPDRALIEFDLPFGEDLAGGALYFGSKDALTFAPRELHGTERNSSLSQAVQSMAWENGVEIPSLTRGINRVPLEGLAPGTTYFFRLLANNAVSRIWNDQTLTFTTPNAGGATVKIAPLIAARTDRQTASPSSQVLRGEPFRTWSYTIQGVTRTLEARLTGIAGSQIQIERKEDGMKGTMSLAAFSKADQGYVAGKRSQ